MFAVAAGAADEAVVAAARRRGCRCRRGRRGVVAALADQRVAAVAADQASGPGSPRAPRPRRRCDRACRGRRRGCTAPPIWALTPGVKRKKLALSLPGPPSKRSPSQGSPPTITSEPGPPIRVLLPLRRGRGGRCGRRPGRRRRRRRRAGRGRSRRRPRSRRCRRRRRGASAPGPPSIRTSIVAGTLPSTSTESLPPPASTRMAVRRRGRRRRRRSGSRGRWRRGTVRAVVTTKLESRKAIVTESSAACRGRTASRSVEAADVATVGPASADAVCSQASASTRCRSRRRRAAVEQVRRPARRARRSRRRRRSGCRHRCRSSLSA